MFSNKKCKAPMYRQQGNFQHSAKMYGPDRIGLVGFHDRGFVIAKPANAHAPWLQERTSLLHSRVSGSWTNLTDGLRVAVKMSQNTPRGILRRIWLLTDGWPNKEIKGMEQVVEQARKARININTIGFGDPGEYDERLLRQIATATHGGAYLPVQSLRQLSTALAGGENIPTETPRRRQSETTVLSIDLSGSMLLPMGNRKRIEVVEEAVLHLLNYKQKCFS